MKHGEFDSNGEITLTLTCGHLLYLQRALTKASNASRIKANDRKARGLKSIHFEMEAKGFRAYAEEFRDLNRMGR